MLLFCKYFFRLLCLQLFFCTKLTSFIDDAFEAVSQARQDLMLKEGIAEGTLVDTENGLVPVEQLKVGTKVRCYSFLGEEVFREVKFIASDLDVNRYIEICFAENDEKIIVGVAQRVLCCRTRSWRAAQDLRVDEILLVRGGYKKIKYTNLICNPIKLYSLHIDEFHNFFVGQNQLLVHNFAFCFPFFSWLFKSSFFTNIISRLLDCLAEVLCRIFFGFVREALFDSPKADLKQEETPSIKNEPLVIPKKKSIFSLCPACVAKVLSMKIPFSSTLEDVNRDFNNIINSCPCRD